MMEKRSIHPFLAFLDDTEMISRVTDLVREKVRPFVGVAYCCVPVVTRHDLQEGKKTRERRGERLGALPLSSRSVNLNAFQSCRGMDGRMFPLMEKLNPAISLFHSLFPSLSHSPFPSPALLVSFRSNPSLGASSCDPGETRIIILARPLFSAHFFCNKQKHEVKADVSFVLDMQLKQGNSRDVRV